MTITVSRASVRKGQQRRRRTFLVVLGGAFIIGATILVTSAAAFSVFSSTGEGEVSVGSGTVTLSWNDKATPQLDMNVGPLHPAESVQYVYDLVNFGVVDLSTIQISLASTHTVPASDGFQLALDTCSVPWTASGAIYTCPGVEGSLSAERPVTGVISLPESEALSAGGVDFLRFTYRLSDSAPISLETSSGTISIIATGLQRPGQTK